MDEEAAAMTRVVVLNAPILSRSAGLNANLFPKIYKVRGNWTAWLLSGCGLLVVLSPKVIVPLIRDKPLWPLTTIWGHGLYTLWVGLYTALVLLILTTRIPSALERKPGVLTVHFLMRKVQIAISEIEEVRVVRKWVVEDSVQLVAKSAPSLCSPCVPSRFARSTRYEELGAPKQKVKRCFPFSLCEPLSCCDSDKKFFWGAPGLLSKEVCIVSVRSAACNNYAFDLVNMEEFITDNRADYSCVGVGGIAHNAPPPQIIGMAPSTPLKLQEDKASPMSTTASASPLDTMASPMSSFASPMDAFALSLVGASVLGSSSVELQQLQETSSASFEELRTDLSTRGSSGQNSPLMMDSPRSNL